MLYLIDQFQVSQLCLKRVGKTYEIKLFDTVICHLFMIQESKPSWELFCSDTSLMHGFDNQWQKTETTKYRKPYKSNKWHTVD